MLIYQIHNMIIDPSVHEVTRQVAFNFRWVYLYTPGSWIESASSHTWFKPVGVWLNHSGPCDTDRCPVLGILGVLGVWRCGVFGVKGCWGTDLRGHPMTGVEDGDVFGVKGFWGTDLRGHPMTDVEDGDVVSVRPLVQTQVSLQGVLQLQDTVGE